MRISDWRSGVSFSDLNGYSVYEIAVHLQRGDGGLRKGLRHGISEIAVQLRLRETWRSLTGRHSISEIAVQLQLVHHRIRLAQRHSISEIAVQLQPEQKTTQSLFGQDRKEHTSELQSLMRISYAVFCLKKKKQYDVSKSISRSYTHKLHLNT